jgi:hypothetical protein
LVTAASAIISSTSDYVNYFTILSIASEICQILRATPARRLDPSSAAEPDRHLIAVNDHGHRAPPVAEREHALQIRRVLLHVDVLERNLPPLKVVTGGLRVRSSVLAEDVNHVLIVAPTSNSGQTRV